MKRWFFGFAVAIALLGALGGFIDSASAGPGGARDECTLDDGYNRYRSCSAGGG